MDGGLFLIGKSTFEIHEKLEGEEGHEDGVAGGGQLGRLGQAEIVGRDGSCRAVAQQRVDDLARGDLAAAGAIRAEVTRWEDLVRLGSEGKCREAGKLRLEGKEYVVQDGDILHFRFNV